MREKKVDMRTLEISVSMIEDDSVREVLEDLLAVLKKQQDRIAWIETYAEGVR